MATEWFFQSMGEAIGPLTSEELKERATAGSLQQDTLVRRGKGDWFPAYEITGLFPESTSSVAQKKAVAKITKQAPVHSSSIGKPDLLAGSLVKHRYKMVQIPPGIVVQEGQKEENAAAGYLEKVVNDHASRGWEFFRVDSFEVSVPLGCLAALFGVKFERYNTYVVTFRRAIDE